jgi:O-antigen/teichoic acid export membrane protein
MSESAYYSGVRIFPRGRSITAKYVGGMTSRVEISKRLVAINAASGVLARTINISVVVWLHQYLLRRISPEEYSLLPLLMSIIVLLPLVTSVLTAGLGRFVLTAYTRGDDRGVTQIVSTMFPLLVGAALLMLGAGWTFAWHVDKILCVSPERLWDARCMMALLVFSAAVKPPCTAFSVGFYVRQKFVWYNLLSVGNELLRLSLLFVLLFGLGARVLWVVVANVTAELVLTTATLILSRRLIPALRFRVREIQWARARELMSFGGWSFAGEMAYRLRETAILFILNRMATPLDVAVYSIGSLGRRQIDTWMNVLAGPLYPVVTSMHAVGAADRVRAVYLRGGRLALWMVLVAAVPAAIYAAPIIRLYAGPGYLEAAVVMVLMLATLAIANGAWMVWQVANATGRVRRTAVCTIITQLSILVPAWYAGGVLGWGATGVALAGFLASALTGFFLLWPLGLNLADVSFARWVRETLIPGLAPGCVAGVAWAVLNVAVQPDTWGRLGLCVLGGVPFYFGVVGLCLEPRDREDLTKALVRLKHLGQAHARNEFPPDMSSGMRLSSVAEMSRTEE